jgi:hypothetical protein
MVLNVVMAMFLATADTITNILLSILLSVEYVFKLCAILTRPCQ